MSLVENAGQLSVRQGLPHFKLVSEARVASLQGLTHRNLESTTYDQKLFLLQNPVNLNVGSDGSKPKHLAAATPENEERQQWQPHDQHSQQEAQESSLPSAPVLLREICRDGSKAAVD